MKMVFLSVETSKEDWADNAFELYDKKISRFCPFEIVKIKSKGLGREDSLSKKKKESESILKHLEKDDWVILCDEKGSALDSTAFSNKLVKVFESGKRRLVFIIGGAFGVTEEVMKRADWKWQLSSMTLNHFVAQTVALEQIFRALTIWKGIPYHNE